MVVGATVFVAEGAGVLATGRVAVGGAEVGPSVGVFVGGLGVFVGRGVVSAVAVVVAVLDGAGGGLKTGGGGGSPSLGGSIDAKVPIGVGVGSKEASVGVGDWIARGVLTTRGVEVGSSSGVSITSATSCSESSEVGATVSSVRGVLVGSRSASVPTTVGAEIVGRSGGWGLLSSFWAGNTMYARTTVTPPAMISAAIIGAYRVKR